MSKIQSPSPEGSRHRVLARALLDQSHYPVINHSDPLAPWTDAFQGDSETAAAWFEGPLDLQDALKWHAAGYTAAEANLVQNEIFIKAFTTSPEPGSPSLSAPDDWLASGLPPKWVATCLQAGVWNSKTGDVLYAAAKSSRVDG